VSASCGTDGGTDAGSAVDAESVKPNPKTAATAAQAAAVQLVIRITELHSPDG
jgi:hypothetical protein